MIDPDPTATQHEDVDVDADASLVSDELIVEEVSIDGMCGVY